MRKLGRYGIASLIFGVGLIVLLAFGLYWQFGRGNLQVSIDHQDVRSVVLGRVLYGEQCASCHGTDLEGQPSWRVRKSDGKLPAPPHDETGHTWHHGDQQLFELTKYGTAAFVGGNYESDMLGYEGVLTDREILAVLAFIKSTWPNEVRERHDQINWRIEQQ